MDEELRKILDNYFSARCQSEGSDTPVSDERRDTEKTAQEIMALIDSYGREARIEELQEINLLVNEFDFKKIDRGIKAYNPAFRDFRMGFVIAKGFIQKTIANRIAVLTAEKSKDE